MSNKNILNFQKFINEKFNKLNKNNYLKENGNIIEYTFDLIIYNKIYILYIQQKSGYR